MEKITWRIWQCEGMGKALLIGGLLFYVPLVNLLLLGYYGRWARQLILREGMDLPEWRDGRAIFEELGRVILPALVWIGIPVVLASLVTLVIAGLLFFLRLSLFAYSLAWLPVSIVVLLSPLAVTIAWIRLYQTGSVRESLDVPGISQSVIRNLKSCLFPLIQFFGILLIGFPLIGFASFLAILPLLAQLILRLRDGQGSLKSVPI